MPIDRTVFTREFTLLLERFGRDPHPLMTQRYFEYLNARLTTSEFETAARKIFEQDQFWPAPVAFLHAAKGDPAQLARQEWDALIESAAKNELAELSEAGKKALRALGGWSTVAYADQARLPSLRRAFLESYGDQGPAQVPHEALQLEGTP
ncbi:MAG: hypothetical protein WDA15_06280 [Trueperaceae bacterium]